MSPLWVFVIVFGTWCLAGFAYSKFGSEVKRLRRLVEEAARLQRINREREKRGFPVIYNTDIDKEWKG